MVAHQESHPATEGLQQMSDEKACPFCAEPIKAAAIICKHCGRNVDSASRAAPSPPAPAKTARWPFVVLGLGIAFVVLLVVAGHEPAEGSASGARGICEKFVASNLRDPNSVEWVSSHRWPTEKDGVGWIVDVEYRARNGFGGLNHERRICKVMHTGGGNWRLVDLR